MTRDFNNDSEFPFLLIFVFLSCFSFFLSFFLLLLLRLRRRRRLLLPHESITLVWKPVKSRGTYFRHAHVRVCTDRQSKQNKATAFFLSFFHLHQSIILVGRMSSLEIIFSSVIACVRM